MTGRLFPNLHLPAEGEVDLRPAIGAFGRYDLLEKLGEGHDTEVFVARSDGFEGLFRLNALKRLKPERCADVSRVSRFIEEARLAVRVEHPGTGGVDDFGRVGGVYFIAFELIDGVTAAQLQDNLRARRLTLDVRAAAFIVRHAAGALDHAHRLRSAHGEPLGLVHGALQPREVWVTTTGRVKLRGFAAQSVFVDAALLDDVVGAAGVGCIAPEVLAGAPPTPGADVWSLGVLLWELLVGARLFGASAARDVRDAVAQADIPDPSTLRAGVPLQLLDVIEGALCRDPARRTPDARAVAGQLAEWLDGAGYGTRAFRATLADLDDDEARAAHADRDSTKVVRTGSSRASRPEPPASSSGASSVATKLEKDPGTWGLVRVAERTVLEGTPEARAEARAMFRAAAVLFASRGQLAQALCAYDGARALSGPDDVATDLRSLAALGSGGRSARQQELARVGGLPFYDALRAQTEGGVDRGAAMPTPFLSALSPEGFARIAQLSHVRRVPAGQSVLREGEPGDSLFAVGDGRLVVTCTPSGVDPVDVAAAQDWSEETDPSLEVRRGKAMVASDSLRSELERIEPGEGTQIIDINDKGSRVFLSALTAGDIFGEFSFLTGRPRSASVEAVTTCRVVEITRRAVGGLLEENVALRDAVEAFYKERVLEWMLAKNEVFSMLEPERRRQLLAQCGVYDIPKGKMVVREGELHDAMYFIKRGEVEVTLDDNGTRVFINKLGAGEFFGEIAALEGGPRRASVRAVTDLEAFRITRADLSEVLDDAPEARERLEVAMRARSAELKQRIAEQRHILGST